MAVQREPTASGQKQIQNLFQKLAQGEAIFLPIKSYKSWYGINNEAAAKKFKDSWQEFCRTNKHPVEQLSVGQLSRPSGYLLVRKSDLKGFLGDL